MKKPRRLFRKPTEWQTMRPVVFATGENTKTIADETFSIFQNDKYTVLVRDVPASPSGWPEMIHLSIRRNDRHPIHDWRDFQRIKNDLVGPNNEGVELYPSERRLVDTANQYHIYVLKDTDIKFPFGYNERLVLNSDSHIVPGAKQRNLSPVGPLRESK